MRRVCLDTGVLSIYFSEPVIQDSIIAKIIQEAKQGKCEIHILMPILVEVFNHLCALKGKEIAKLTLLSFINRVPIKKITLNDSLVYSAGVIKCQHRTRLSYNDSMIIAYCLNNKPLTLHTTEKHIKDIPSNVLDRLTLVTHKF
ncbi:MAG: PIN domain-containing protein [Promethearchaeota archaeon]